MRPTRPGPFTIALGLVLVVSLLPRPWLAPWTGRISELVSLPLVPIGDGFRAVRAWLVPSRETVITEREAVILEDQANQLRQMLDRAEAEIGRLAAELARYRELDAEGLGGRYRFVSARLVGSEPYASGERLHVLNAGSARGITPGSQVVHRKNILLGMVVGDEVGRTRTLVRPVESRLMGRVEARIVLGGENESRDLDTARVMAFLEPDGTGWNASIDEADAAGVRPGHQVVVADETWTDAVGMRIGRVVSVRPSPTNPLWRDVRIEPIESLAELHEVEVLVPVPPPGPTPSGTTGGGS